MVDTNNKRRIVMANETADRPDRAVPHTGSSWQMLPAHGMFTYKRCRLHYCVWGNKENPPLVLLHGFMQSCASWDAVAQALQDTYCVYALDFMGHGSSDKPFALSRYAYNDMAQSVHKFLKKVVLAPSKKDKCSNKTYNKAHLLGYSMGGRIALALLEICPDLLASVCLESCNIGCATEEERLHAAQRNNGWVERLRNEGMEAFVRYWENLELFASQKESGWDVLLRPGRLTNDAHAMALCLEGAGKQAMPLSGQTLTRIRQATKTIPLHYIYGTSDAKSAVVAQTLQEAGVFISAIPGGHNVHLEAWMLYLKEVRTFLASLD